MTFEWRRGLGVGPWIVSLTGVVLADVAFWFLLNYRFFDFSRTPLVTTTFVLKGVELALMVGFSGVLIYSGYWLATSDYSTEETWWVSLWCIIGLAGICTVIVLVQAHHIAAGKDFEPWMLLEELLMGAGGGGVAGLLIGLSTAQAMYNERTVVSQRNAFAFLNRFLRHHVLNGVQVIQGQAHILSEYANDEARERLDIIDDRSDAIADLTQNARVVAETISGEAGITTVDLSRVMRAELADVREDFDDATFDADIPEDVHVRANESLSVVVENLFRNAVVHNDADDPTVTIRVDADDDAVEFSVADDGPGVPEDRRETIFAADGPANDGFGLYLGKTIVDHYGGDIHVTDNEPRGAVFTVELQTPNA